MLVVIPKWHVIVTFNNADMPPVNFAISDRHWANVMSALARMDFGNDVQSVEVSREPDNQQVGVSYTGAGQGEKKRLPVLPDRFGPDRPENEP